MGIHHEQFGPVHDALNRMKRACDRGTGCHLTAKMIQAMSLTFMGELWGSEDPRLDRPNLSSAEER